MSDGRLTDEELRLAAGGRIESYSRAIADAAHAKALEWAAKRADVILRGVYAEWHACGLRKPERGMPKGTLCDDCSAAIAIHVAAIREGAKP